MTATSATLGGVESLPRSESYRDRWRTVPRELLFHAPTVIIVSVAFAVLTSLFSAGASLLTIFVGVFLLTVTLWVARWFGELELNRLEAAGMPRIARPRWKQPGEGFWSKVLTPLADGHRWMYLLHGNFVNFVVGIVTWSLVLSWVAGAAGGLTYWFWAAFIPEDDFYLSEVIVSFFTRGAVVIDGRVGDPILHFILGAVLLVTLPFVTRGLLRVHHGIASGMLGSWWSDDLARQVDDLSASRGAAVAAEGHSLRRLERDIHDGPQQRLVRLQMDLASAERALETDPDAARERLAEAAAQSREALEELRALSRGFAPPILLDRGLVAALESLALRNPVPVTVTSVTTGTPLPAEVERNAYFIVSELVTNATKHAEASAIGVQVAVKGEAGARVLEVVVGDNGHGGAQIVEGHGLAGLVERAHGLGGTLEIDSAEGGPTTVTARIPLTA